MLLAGSVVLALAVLIVDGRSTAPHGGSSPAALLSGMTTAVLPRCKPAASPESGSGGGGLGHIAYRVEFRNMSNQGCSLTGYPVVTASLVGAG